MPNLDAEVLNEPKKQIVKDFNKEEIVQIIQNAIDKGIINLGDIGGSEVVANPALAGTESNLEGLEVDGEKYKIPEGTVVEANPTLAGTEDALTGLQVGDTKYAVGGGNHVIALSTSSGDTYIKTNTLFVVPTSVQDLTSLIKFLGDNGYTSNGMLYHGCLSYLTNISSATYSGYTLAVGIWKKSKTTIGFYSLEIRKNTSTGEISLIADVDKVINGYLNLF